MRYVVTGGAGFVGSHLVKLLVKNGHDVTVIDNLIKGGAGQAVQNLNYYFGYNAKKGLL